MQIAAHKLQHNILVNVAGTDGKLNVMLTDFGVANFADSTNFSASLQRTGASRWMAPEILSAADSLDNESPGIRNPDVEKPDIEDPDDVDTISIIHTRESDVFSLGMCMLQVRVYGLAAGKPYSNIKCGIERS